MNLSVGITVASIISDVCKAIGGLVGEQAPVLANSAESVIKDGKSFFKDTSFSDLTPLEIGIKAIELVSNLIETITPLFGVENNDSALELALKARYAELKPEDFSTWQEYISYLNAYTELPENAVNGLSDIQKIAYQVAGCALLIGTVNEKLELVEGLLSFDDFVVAAKVAMTAEECVNVVKGLISDGLNPNSFGKYLRNDADMSYGHKINVQESFISSMKEIHPDINDNDIIERINNMRDILQ